MVALRCQTLAAATQFDGTGVKGFWGFSDWDLAPRTTRIVLLSISYHEPGVVDPTLTVEIWASRPGGLATERMPIAIGIAGAGGQLVNPITGAGELRACGITLPRDLPSSDLAVPGAQWQVHLATKNKIATATACLDWMLCPFPDTDARDSRDK